MLSAQLVFFGLGNCFRGIFDVLLNRSDSRIQVSHIVFVLLVVLFVPSGLERIEPPIELIPGTGIETAAGSQPRRGPPPRLGASA